MLTIKVTFARLDPIVDVKVNSCWAGSSILFGFRFKWGSVKKAVPGIDANYREATINNRIPECVMLTLKFRSLNVKFK
jgi:hypothetical protein